MVGSAYLSRSITMTNEETAEKIRAWCRKGRGHFSWPTDGCGYKQHIRFVRYKAKHWKGGTPKEFQKFAEAYANQL